MKLEWELLEGGDLYRFTGATERAKIPGGWLYRTMKAVSGTGAGVGVALVFVPEHN